MDQSTQKTTMDPYDTKISIDKVLTQEKKWFDALNSTSVNVKDKDPVSAGCIAWMISKDMLLGSPIINAKEENLRSQTQGMDGKHAEDGGSVIVP